MFDFLKGKKKRDEFMELGGEPEADRYGPAGFPREAAMPMRRPVPGPAPTQPMDMGLPSAPAQPAMGFPTSGSGDLQRDIQTLSYKLDNLKSALDNISARLANIESAMRTQPKIEKPESGWTY